jgi:hypothetical protein
VLLELSVMEQRYQAVLAVVQDGWKVTEVAARLGVKGSKTPIAQRRFTSQLMASVRAAARNR